MIAELLSRAVLPLGVALALLALAFALATRSPVLGRRLLALAFALLAVFSLPAVSAALIRSLEGAYPSVPIESLPRLEVAVLLGGGLQPALAPRHRAELGPGADRLWLAAQLWHAGKVERLLISSGTPFAADGTTEAELTARILRRWGVPAEAMLIERTSLDTAGNAAASAARLGATAGGRARPVGLITSASHMRRAMALFRAAGFAPLALPADHWIAGPSASSVLDWLPSAINLGGSTRALREYLGIGWYLLSGRLRWRDVVAESLPQRGERRPRAATA